MNKSREHKRSGMHLKKIAAAKGKIRGSFYFASNASGDHSIVVVRIAKKASQLREASTVGKKHKQKISGAKFAVGVIFAEGSKVIFEVQAGTAPIRLLKMSFREHLSSEPPLQLLKKVTIRKASTGEDGASTAEVEEGELIQEADIAGVLEAELEELIADQQKIAELNHQLALVNKESAAAEFHQQVQHSKRHIEQLQADVVRNPTDSGYRELHNARVQFAESMATGPNPFRGGALSPELTISIQVAASSAIEALQQTFTTITSEQLELAELIMSSADETEQERRHTQHMPRYRMLDDASKKYQEAMEKLYAQIPL